MSNGFGPISSVQTMSGDWLIVSQWWTSAESGLRLQITDGDMVLRQELELTDETARHLAAYLLQGAEAVEWVTKGQAPGKTA